MIERTGNDSGSNQMMAAVLDKAMSMRIATVEVPVPREDEALVRVHCVGLCGSDLHYYQHGKIGPYEVKAPIILGHELAGEVVAVGAAVRSIAIGDRVAVEPGTACGKCAYCKVGRYNLCPHVVFMATPPVNGAWSTYVAVREDFLFRLPDGISYEQGALLEPLSVGIHAMRRTSAAPGDRVFVSGLGPIGMLVCQAAAWFGVQHIYASDVIPERRAMAEALGLARTFDPTDERLAERIAEATDGEGCDVAVESSGNEHAIANLTDYARRGGRVAWIGLPALDRIPIPVSDIIDKELRISGIFRYANTYDTAIRMLQKQSNVIESLITHRFALKDIQQALDTAINEKHNCMKVMIYPDEERM